MRRGGGLTVIGHSDRDGPRAFDYRPYEKESAHERDG